MIATAGIIAQLPNQGNVYTMVWRNAAVTCRSREELIEMLITTIESRMSPPDAILYWDEANNCSLHSVLEFLPFERFPTYRKNLKERAVSRLQNWWRNGTR